MMRSFRSSCLLLLMALSAVWARGDTVPDVTWHLRNAETVLLVRATTPADAELNPELPGRPYLAVERVLRGFFPASFIAYDPESKSGPEAVILLRYEHPRSDPRTESDRRSVWPVQPDGRVDVQDVPDWEPVLAADARGPRGAPPALFTLGELERRMAAYDPDACNLQELLVAAVLFPDQLAAREKSDPARAAYACFAAAVHDLARDVPALAALVAARDLSTGVAADAKLRALLPSADLAPLPANAAAIARREQSRRWQSWWRAHATGQRWEESRLAFVPRRPDDAPARYWPALPASLKTVDTEPAALVAALARGDAAAFAPAFRQWLDSGPVRDRFITASVGIPEQMTYAVHGVGGGGPSLPPAPRLAADLLLGRDLSAHRRMQIIALVAKLWHWGRFKEETAATTAFLAQTPDIETLRRAAFWEIQDDEDSPNRAALKRLAAMPDEATQRFLAALFIDQFGSGILDTGHAEIRANRSVFMDILLEHIGSHRDEPAQWAARTFCVEGKPEVLPLILPWLTDANPKVRSQVHVALRYQPLPEIVPALLAGLAAAKSTAERSDWLVTLAQTGDPRGLDWLCAACDQDYPARIKGEFVRGLARIADARALPVLAKVALQHQDDERTALAWEAVTAFGRISHRFKAPPPSSYGSSGGTEPRLLKSGLADIAAWQAVNAP